MFTPEEYKKYVEERSPKSGIVKDTLLAFLFGGAICLLAEWIYTMLLRMGLSEEIVRDALPVIMVFLASALTAIGWFSKLGAIGGAGTTIPITGFSNAVTAAAMEFRSEGLILGMGAKIFTVAGPVIAYGAIASVLCGIVYYFVTLFF